MNYFSIDFLIVYAFLAITLVIGIRAGRGIKDIREYALGNKIYGVAILVFTFLATNIGGGSTLDAASDVFSNGIIGSIVALGVAIQLLIFAIWIAPHMKYFNNCLTIGDVMGSFYGQYSQIFTGILGTLYSFCMIGMQLLVLGIICESLINIPATFGIILGGLLLIFYSSYGGIKAVTATDILQFLVLFIVIPMIASIAINKVGGINEVFMRLPLNKVKIFTHEKFPTYLSLFLIWSVLPLGLISPPIFQRLLMAKQPGQLRTQYLIVAGFDPVFRITIMMIGLAGLVLYPHIQASNVIPHIIKELLPIGLKGFAIAGMLAVVMSTGDSYLHTAGLLLVHDVIKPILNKTKISINELRWVQYITCIIGIISIIIGLKSKNALNLSFGAMRIAGPVLLFPLLAGIIGIKPDKKPFYGTMIITIITFMLTTLLLPKSYSHLGVPISIVINAISFLIIHFIQNGKIVMVDRSDHEAYTSVKHQHTSILKNLKHYLPTLSNIREYSKHKIEQYGAPYILFGIFYAINFTYPYFMWSVSNPFAPNLMLIVRFIGALLCGLLIANSKWPKSLVPYLPAFFHIAILYCLPFTSTMMFLLTQGSIEWLVNIMAITILLFILVDWVTALVLGSLGIIIAFAFYNIFVGKIDLSLDFTAKYLLLYQGIFGLLIGLIFARRKQKSFDKVVIDKNKLSLVNEANKEALLETFKDKIRLVRTLGKAKVKSLPKAVNIVKDLISNQEKGIRDEDTIKARLEQLKNILLPMAVTLDRVENRATDYLRLDVDTIIINTLLEQIQEKLPNIKLHIINNSSYHEIICDPKRIEKLLINSIELLVTPQQKDIPIYITLSDTQLDYKLPSVKKDGTYIKGVPALAFTISTDSSMPDIQPFYQTKDRHSTLPIPTNPSSLLLITNERIIKAHYGYTNIDARKDTNYNMHLYVLPVKVNEVRPRDMDDKYMELGEDLVRADDTFPGALEQELDFLVAVKGKMPNVNMVAIETAIEMIKLQHGAVKRKSGEPFYLHPLAVAQIVLDYNSDEVTILAALLHDVVEDTALLLESIEMIFGKEVAGIVDVVTHFESSKESFYRIKLSSQENILMLLETEEKRALYVKIADRMHNMRTIEGHKSYERKKQIAEETLQFFVPIAEKLGLQQAADELKEKSMRVINSPSVL